MSSLEEIREWLRNRKAYLRLFPEDSYSLVGKYKIVPEIEIIDSILSALVKVAPDNCPLPPWPSVTDFDVYSILGMIYRKGIIAGKEDFVIWLKSIGVEVKEVRDEKP